MHVTNLLALPASVLAINALHAAATPAGPATASTNGTAIAAASEPTAEPHNRARSRVWRCLKRSLQAGSRRERLAVDNVLAVWFSSRFQLWWPAKVSGVCRCLKRSLKIGSRQL